MGKELFLKTGKDFLDRGTSMIIYGKPGVGKTSLVKTLLGWDFTTNKFSNEPYCKPGEILILDIDAGLRVLEGIEGLYVAPIKEDLETFKEVYNTLKTKPYPFKFIVVDNMSELEKFFVLGLAKLRNLEWLRVKEWGDGAQLMRRYIRGFRDLVHNGTNVIFIFWDMLLKEEDKDGNISSRIAPMCMQKTTLEFCGLVDFVGYMDSSSKGERRLQFDPDHMIVAKKRDTSDIQLLKVEKPNLGEIFMKLRPNGKGEGNGEKEKSKGSGS